MTYHSRMSLEERWERVGELLYKGACLLEEENKLAQDTQEKETYTLHEIARLFKVSHRTIQRKVTRKGIRVYRRNNGLAFIKKKDFMRLQNEIRTFEVVSS